MKLAWRQASNNDNRKFDFPSPHAILLPTWVVSSVRQSRGLLSPGPQVRILHDPLIGRPGTLMCRALFLPIRPADPRAATG
mgnify:CR=1 FL=1